MSDHIAELERRLSEGDTWEKKRHALIQRDWSAPVTGKGNPTQIGNRRFSGAGAVSVTQGFDPSEVNKARSLMPRSAGCIKDDGRVIFPDSRSEQTFRQEFEKVRPRSSLD